VKTEPSISARLERVIESGLGFTGLGPFLALFTEVRGGLVPSPSWRGCAMYKLAPAYIIGQSRAIYRELIEFLSVQRSESVLAPRSPLQQPYQFRESRLG
jgi:hypothetical protein